MRRHTIKLPICLTCGGRQGGKLSTRPLNGDEQISVCPSCCTLVVKRNGRWRAHEDEAAERDTAWAEADQQFASTEAGE